MSTSSSDLSYANVTSVVMTYDQLNLVAKILQKNNKAYITKARAARIKSSNEHRPLVLDNYVDIKSYTQDGVVKYYVAPLNPDDAVYNLVMTKPAPQVYNEALLRSAASLTTNFQQLQVPSQQQVAPQQQQQQQQQYQSNVSAVGFSNPHLLQQQQEAPLRSPFDGVPTVASPFAHIAQ